MKHLSEVIKDWEMKHGVTVDTIRRVKSGDPVKPTSVYQVAKAFGCTDEVAKAYADKANAAPTGPAKRRTA